MAGERGRFLADAFHQVAVAADAVREVVDDCLIVPVVDGAQMRFGDRHPERIADSLAKRPGRRFDPRRALGFGVSRRLTAELTEVFDVVEGQLVAGEVEQRVEQHRAVTGGQYETVAIEPVRIFGIEVQMARPQRVGHRRGSHRHAGMAGVCFLYGVDGQKADGVDSLLVGGRVRHEISFPTVGL